MNRADMVWRKVLMLCLIVLLAAAVAAVPVMAEPEEGENEEEKTTETEKDGDEEQKRTPVLLGNRNVDYLLRHVKVSELRVNLASIRRAKGLDDFTDYLRTNNVRLILKSDGSFTKEDVHLLNGKLTDYNGLFINLPRNRMTTELNTVLKKRIPIPRGGLAYIIDSRISKSNARRLNKAVAPNVIFVDLPRCEIDAKLREILDDELDVKGARYAYVLNDRLSMSDAEDITEAPSYGHVVVNLSKAVPTKRLQRALGRLKARDKALSFSVRENVTAKGIRALNRMTPFGTLIVRVSGRRSTHRLAKELNAGASLEDMRLVIDL